MMARWLDSLSASLSRRRPTRRWPARRSCANPSKFILCKRLCFGSAIIRVLYSPFVHAKIIIKIVAKLLHRAFFLTRHFEVWINRLQFVKASSGSSVIISVRVDLYVGPLPLNYLSESAAGLPILLVDANLCRVYSLIPGLTPGCRRLVHDLVVGH